MAESAVEIKILGFPGGIVLKVDGHIPLPALCEDPAETSSTDPIACPWQVAIITTHIKSRMISAIRRVILDIDFIIHPLAGAIFTYPG